MTFRIRLLLLLAALAGLLAAGFVGCYHAPVVVADPTHDRVAQQCHRAIRVRVIEGFGGRTEVSFDTPEHYYVSRTVEGVRGGGLRRAGHSRDRIYYNCTVDIHSGRLQTARFRVVDAAQHTRVRSVDLCQQKIRDEIAADRGRRAVVKFDSAETFRHSFGREEVRGEAKLKVGKRWEGVRYECAVDPRRGRVSQAWYRALEATPPSNQQIVEACQMVMREMVAADHGRRAKVGFETAETASVSNRERRVHGRGLLRIGRDRDPIDYRCAVDARNAKVSEARYRRIDRPQDLTQRSVELCHDAVRERVASGREGRISTVFETSETYFVSNSEEGVRGEGMVKHGFRGRDPIGYDCRVNIRRGRVTEARYRYR